jgi:hypothetical protein
MAPAAWELVHVHPYELSYYNALIGGPRGAWRRGFELTYWCDSLNNQALDELNRRLPPAAEIDFPNDLTNPMTLQELQTLGALRSDLRVGGDIHRHSRQYDQFGYVWLQTQDSKATSFSRLLYAMRPWYALEPRQLEGLRVTSVADPIGVSRAWALDILLNGPDRSKKPPPSAPLWVQKYVPILGRFWGDGLKTSSRLALNQDVLNWARNDPRGLVEAARIVAGRQGASQAPGARRLIDLITLDPNQETVAVRKFYLDRLLKTRPEALVEGARILVDHLDEVTRVMLRYGYTDPGSIGCFLDRDL